MDNKQKILVCGGTVGNFRQLFNRLESINKKNGPFDMMLCVGDFFAPDESGNVGLEAYRNGNRQVVCPTYILGPSSGQTVDQYAAIPESGELCPNLTYLGGRGLYTISSGIKIAYVSGVQAADPKKAAKHEFVEEDVRAVRNACLTSKSYAGEYRGIDILITAQWPKGVGDAQQQQKHDDGSDLLSWLAHEIRPRYHFCGLVDQYFERLPYRNDVGANTNLKLATRFISLAFVGNAKKDKYLYALNIMPVEQMRVLELIQQTTNETPCPYDGLSILKTHSADNNSDDKKQFFFDTSDNNKRKAQDSHEDHRKRQKKVYSQEKCWFCLSSSSVEKHLVITVGEHFYLALAKGPINETHCLLLPVTHVQCAALLSQDSWDELDKFKEALAKMFKAAGKVTCFFERNYRSSHLQVNVVAADANAEWHIKNAFEETAEKYDLTLETLPPLKEPADLPQKSPYFVAQLADGTALLTRQMKMFPLHFGREAFCSENVLNLPDKADWKECALSQDEETSLVKQFRNQFQPFDFTA